MITICCNCVYRFDHRHSLAPAFTGWNHCFFYRYQISHKIQIFGIFYYLLENSIVNNVFSSLVYTSENCTDNLCHEMRVLAIRCSYLVVTLWHSLYREIIPLFVRLSRSFLTMRNEIFFYSLKPLDIHRYGKARRVVYLLMLLRAFPSLVEH